MVDSQTPHEPQEFMILYKDHGSSKEDIKTVSIFAKDVRDAVFLFGQNIANGNIDIRITGIYKPLLESEDPWERNVQHLRVEFPPLQDSKQDDEALVLAKMIEEYMKQRFVGFGYKTTGVVSLGGFYRGDHNWDNIDEPDACVNHPNRGSGENEP